MAEILLFLKKNSIPFDSSNYQTELHIITDYPDKGILNWKHPLWH